MKIGFIGCGNMAGAIINGLISSGTAEGKDINIFDINENAMYSLKEQHGCNICKDEEDTAERSNVLFLAVKPNVIGYRHNQQIRKPKRLPYYFNCGRKGY